MGIVALRRVPLRKKREQMKPHPARVTLTPSRLFTRVPSLFYFLEIDRHFISLAVDYPNILWPDRLGDEKSDYFLWQSISSLIPLMIFWYVF